MSEPEHFTPIVNRLFVYLREMTLETDTVSIDTGHGRLVVARMTFNEWQRRGWPDDQQIRQMLREQADAQPNEVTA